ncbi:MAG: SusC/RagA family TonB-linked outer membrane protein [Marinifilaceae bacterium]|jgi:TonB-linked SusC/RagA family outer membrane protein|nr:SusC/RagA family TonB-linked outer membrane protein [Marinifilaceae bacterium]
MKKQLDHAMLHSGMTWKKTFMIMKSLLVCMFLGIIQLSANNVYSQNQKVSLNLENASLYEILNVISNQTDYEFLYNHSLVESKGTIDLKVENKSVKDVLNYLFDKNMLEYQMKDNLIVVSRMSREKFLQKNTVVITGVVKDKKGVSLPGASVFIEGTSIGTSTDIDGKYSLKFVNTGDIKITFSFVGLKSKTVKYKGQKKIDVVLQADSQYLDEVVVTGYQTLSKERATGAFEKVDVGVLDNKATMNIIDKLEGQTTGVLFDKSGNMEIRGQSTIFANKKPLIVVDGFPIEGSMETINPNDIENITVLKDAAAASIWGARAANGVIVIVSKKAAKVGKPVINFSTSLSITDTPNLYDLPVASTASFLEFEKHYADSRYIDLPKDANQFSLSAGMEAFLKMRDGIYTQDQVNAVLSKIGNRDVRDEFKDLFLRKATRQQYNLSISGKTKNNSYYASVSYDDNKSFSKQNNSNRFISNLALESKLSERLSINLGINAAMRNTNTNGIDYTRVLNMTQYQQILDSKGNYVTEPRSYYQGFKDNLVAQGFPYDWNYNTKREYDNADNSSKNLDLKLRVGFNFKIIDGLSLEGRYQYEWGNGKGRNLYNEETYRVRDAVNSRSIIENGKVVSYLPKGSILAESYSNYSAFTTRGQLNFNRSFNDNMHNITAIAGVEVRKVKSESSNMTKYGFDPQSLQYVNVNLNEKFPNPVNGSKRVIGDASKFTQVEDRYLSYYGNIAYTYLEKYTATASARLDDSNLFGADSDYRNVPLWSVGGNWQIHKEDFFNIDFINLLTLRTTYGWNGNVDKSTSPYMIALVAKDWETQNQYAYVNNPKNPKLRWEKTSVMNLGLDFSILNNRLSGSIEYYNKYSDGVLGYVSLNSTYGFSQALMNVAEISNKGIDISLNALAVKKEVKWNVGLNFSYNKNEVMEIEMPSETPSSFLGMKPKVGLPINYMYSYKWAGLSASGTPQVYDENGKIVDYKSPIENASALKYEGTTVPKYYGSLVNTISYKGLSLTLLMTYKFGHVFRENRINYRTIMSQVGMRNWIHKDFDNRWKQAGDEKKTDIPMYPSDSSMLSAYYDSYSTGSSNTVHDASHIRFKEIILSYDLPASLVKPLHISNLKLSAQVRNLGVYVFNSKDLDPENIPNMNGGGINTNPEFTFSLKLTL